MTINNPSFCTSLGGGWWLIDNIKVHQSQMTPEQVATFQRNCDVTLGVPEKNPIPSNKTTTYWNGTSKNFLQHKDLM